jgi:4-hydroxybenzoyl-CoA thioesterase
MSKEFSFDVRIGFGDCDPAGIVYFPNFYRWMDMAVHEMWERAGWPAERIQQELNLWAWPLIDSGATFRSPSTFNQIITIKSTIVSWSNKTFRTEQKVVRREKDSTETFLLEGFTVRFLGEKLPDSFKLKAAVIPDNLKAIFD